MIQAMKDMTLFKSNNLNIDKVSVNLSAKQLYDDSLLDTIK